MTSYKLVLDSQHGNSPSTPARQTFSTSLAISNRQLGWKVALVHAVIPNAVFPTNSTNNVVYIKEDGGSTESVTLTAGCYEGSEYADALETLLNASGDLSGTYVVTFDLISYYLTITVSGAVSTIQLVSGSNNALRQMGFDPGSLLDVASLTGNYPVNLHGTQYIAIASNIGQDNILVGANRPILDWVPLADGCFTVSYHQENTLVFFNTNRERMDLISIELYDDQGNIYDIPVNQSYQLVFIITPITDEAFAYRKNTLDYQRRF